MLYFQVQGSGRPLVLVHGAGTSHEIWRRVVPILANRRRRVIAPDLPGYGASPPAGRGFQFAEVADRLVTGLELQGIDGPFDLVGHSLGGALSTVIADRHPDRVRRLVLVAPAGLSATPPGVAIALERAAGPFARLRRALGVPTAGLPEARRLWLATMVVDPALVPTDDARAVLRSSAQARRIGPGLAAAARADLRAELAALPVPVGLVWGARDPVIPPKRIALVLQLRPDTPVRMIPNTAHAPMLERPEAFARALTDVLRLLRR